MISRTALLVSLLLLSACGGGGSGGSTGGGTVVPTPAPTAPGAPTGVAANAGDGTAVVSFVAPASTGGASISRYDAACSATAQTTRMASGAATPLTVTGLVNGQTYGCTVSATNSAGTGPASAAVSVTPLAPVATADFPGSLVLGAPTDTGVRLKLQTTALTGTAKAFYSAAGETVETATAAVTVTAGKTAELAFAGLKPNVGYSYRLVLTPNSGATVNTRSYAFHTARPAGSSFTFTIQADSHLDENANLDQYLRTLGNVLADQPDFHVDLGDTFMTEKYSEPFTAVLQAATSRTVVDTRYTFERGNFGRVTHSVPLYLVNGNHDAELGWLLDGTPQNLPIWASLARLDSFAVPTPGAFYSGDSVIDPLAGNRVAWYAWTWGDALFVALDPYWNSTQKSSDGWSLTLGARQYQWLATTLSASTARYKFVFLHNLVGGLDGQMRGGIEAAPFYEWGGRNTDGSAGFAARRPGWSMPIHDLLVRNKVTAVFHGHDHVYVSQTLDGIVYQTVPQPSATNNNSGASIAAAYHYASGTILSSSGHLRVTVTPGGVTSRYVRSWLPKDETASRSNGQIDHSWTALPP